MVSASSLVQRFARAGLPLDVAPAPLAGGNREVFQLDIGRAGRREAFRMFPGAASNRVEAEGIDRDLRQLVLFVDEPRRAFEVELSRWAEVPPDAQVVRREGARRWVRQFTSGERRHLLCGMDEKHLFVAQLPRAVSTVRQAHRVLRSPWLDRQERRAPAKTVRQGEWFFVALNPSEVVRVAGLERTLAVQRKAGIAQAARLGRRGRPHVADEVLVVTSGERERATVVIYVRGAVRHPDHATVSFSEWRLVLGNTEPAMAVSGMTWVD